MDAPQLDLGKAIIDTLLSLVPPLLVGGVFYVIMRSILRADSKERAEYARIEAEERAKMAAGIKPAASAGTSGNSDAGPATKTKRK